MWFYYLGENSDFLKQTKLSRTTYFPESEHSQLLNFKFIWLKLTVFQTKTKIIIVSCKSCMDPLKKKKGKTTQTFSFFDLLMAFKGLSTRKTRKDLIASFCKLSRPLLLMLKKEKYTIQFIKAAFKQLQSTVEGFALILK